LKRKITFKKERKIKRMKIKIEKIIHHKLGFNDEIEK
jgi:hypothetical protein